MNDLNITGTQSTPTVRSNRADGVLELTGDSYPENSFQVFAPVIQWVEHYLKQETRPLALKLQLLYLNTSSIKVMMDLFDLLQEAHGDGRTVSVEWLYDQENERVAELALEFKEDCSFPFDVRSKA